MFGWKAVGVDLGAGVGVGWTYNESVGSWFGRDVQRDAVWRFQGAIHCTHAVQLLLSGIVHYDLAMTFVKPGE